MKNILLLHGALGSAEDLAPLALALKGLGATPFTFSFPGHAHVPFGNAFGIEQFANELEQFLHAKDLNNIPVFGYSMGGFTALHLASKQGNLISHIITLGTKFDWSKDAAEKETRMLNLERMLEKIPAYAASLEARHGAAWKELVLKTAQLMKEIHEKNLLDAATLRSIGIPVLLGIACKDQMVTLDETVQTSGLLPQGSLYVLPTGKHQVESVNVDLLSRIIVDFIS